MRAARSCFVLLALAGAAFIALTLPALPPRPATHFNLQGAADGWATRGTYVVFLALIGVGLPLMMVGLVPGLGATKPELLNVPASPPRLPTGPFLGAVAGFLLGLALWIRNLHVTMRPPAGGSTVPG